MDKITNADGWVAVKYRTSNPKTVLIKDKGVTYNFSTVVPGANVVKFAYLSMAWIRPEDVDTILRVQERICCGKSGQAFHLANQLDVNLWLTGNRYGNQS